MKLTQKLIDQIQEALNHTKKDGTVNWQDGDEIEVSVAGTFAADRFIVINNRSKKPWQPSINSTHHPDYVEPAQTFAKSKGIPAPEDIG
tara:strand:+ start:1659 stop:1925 length:267 start_codon:yes stop_codon:yes gene_type:complete